MKVLKNILLISAYAVNSNTLRVWEIKLEIIEDSMYTSIVPKLNADLRVGHGSIQSPVDLSLAHRIIGYVPRSFEQAPWTQIDHRSGLEIHPNLF